MSFQSNRICEVPNEMNIMKPRIYPNNSMQHAENVKSKIEDCQDFQSQEKVVEAVEESFEEDNTKSSLENDEEEKMHVVPTVTIEKVPTVRQSEAQIVKLETVMNINRPEVYLRKEQAQKPEIPRVQFNKSLSKDVNVNTPSLLRCRSEGRLISN